MKKIWGLMDLVLLAAVLSGCIISASPDPGKTVVIKPGAKQIFQVVSMMRTISYDCVWGFSDGDETAESGLQRILPRQVAYTPSREDVGMHTLTYSETEYRIEPIDCMDNPDCIGWKQIPIGHDARTWTVAVPGVTFTPMDSNILEPGIPYEFKAKVWPEGGYTFNWYVDALFVGAGETFTYHPDSSHYGTHTIELRAIGATDTYTYAREVFVTLHDQ